MFVTVVEVKVKPEYLAAFIAASEQNHLASVQEEGNCRFDVLQSADSPDAFILYEAYETEAHAKAHKETVHYLTWRETVAEMMAEPRQGRVFHSIKP